MRDQIASLQREVSALDAVRQLEADAKKDAVLCCEAAIRMHQKCEAALKCHDVEAARKILGGQAELPNQCNAVHALGRALKALTK
jgi:hypothetical protein